MKKHLFRRKINFRRETFLTNQSIVREISDLTIDNAHNRFAIRARRCTGNASTLAKNTSRFQIMHSSREPARPKLVRVTRLALKAPGEEDADLSTLNGPNSLTC